jgi:hypothetical protein
MQRTCRRGKALNCTQRGCLLPVRAAGAGSALRSHQATKPAAGAACPWAGQAVE